MKNPPGLGSKGKIVFRLRTLASWLRTGLSTLMPLALLQMAVWGAAFLPSPEDLNRRSAGEKQSDLSAARAALDQPATKDGLIAIGDMRFRPELVRLQGGFAANLWPDGIVYYEFDPGVTADERAGWLRGVDQWSSVSAVTFLPRTNEPNYIHVKEDPGNWAELGMVGGRQEMGIFTWYGTFVVTHEAGHALGLVHEHQRLDRDNYVNIFAENVMPGYYGVDFAIMSVVDRTPYDFDSLMHYVRNAFSINGLNTIEPKPPYIQWLNLMGRTNHLSVLDASGMAQAYGPPVAMALPKLAAVEGGPGGGQISLRWSPVANALNYRVFYQDFDSTTPYVPTYNGNPKSGSLVGNTTATVISGLNVERYYWVSIKAARGTRETDYATSVGAMPGTIQDDAYEPNETIAAAYDLSSKKKTWLSTIAGPGIQANWDFYRIAASPGLLNLHIECWFPVARGNINIGIYNAAGNWLAFSSTNGDNESLDFTAPAPGNYYVLVSDPNSCGNYDLWWSDDGSAPPSPVAVTQISRLGCAVGLLRAGQPVYADRTYSFVSPIPPALLNQTYIQAIQAERDNTGAGFLSFEIARPSTVLVGLDTRITTPPVWLQSWIPQGETLKTNDPGAANRKLYARSFARGSVTLGPNRDIGMPTGRSMYTVVILPGSSAAQDWESYDRPTR